ncbi:MAG: 2-oxoacid:acceptor oxidoreductase family protein [Christensenellaceae bacterium]
MTEQIILAGFGGQGVLLAGQIIAYAGMNEGKNVSWLPSYGPEMRGGTANCNVVVSDGEVGSPVVVEADCLLVMNRPSLEKYEKDLKSGGLLLINSDLIEVEPKRTDIKIIKVPANTLAEQAGSIKAANMVMLGAYNACAKVVKNKTIIECLAKIMGAKKAKLIPMNETALQLGADAAK